MTRTIHHLIPQPFHPIRSFLAYATGEEQIVLKEEYVSFDLIGAITTARKTYEAGVSVRAAVTIGGDAAPMVAELHARFKDQAKAMGYVVTPATTAEFRSAAE